MEESGMGREMGRKGRSMGWEGREEGKIRLGDLQQQRDRRMQGRNFVQKFSDQFLGLLSFSSPLFPSYSFPIHISLPPFFSLRLLDLSLSFHSLFLSLFLTRAQGITPRKIVKMRILTIFARILEYGTRAQNSRVLHPGPQSQVWGISISFSRRAWGWVAKFSEGLQISGREFLLLKHAWMQHFSYQCNSAIELQVIREVLCRMVEQRIRMRSFCSQKCMCRTPSADGSYSILFSLFAIYTVSKACTANR